MRHPLVVSTLIYRRKMNNVELKDEKKKEEK